MRRLFLVAGEPSGDRLGADLMRALKARGPIAFEGVGGPLMAREGLASRFAMADLAVMGIVEVVPRLRMLLRRIDETARAVVQSRADALVTIDAPSFCLRVTPKVKAARPGMPCIHYVAPSVWAWRPGRARLMAQSVDHVLALLPFEPPYMTAAGMGCDFVGHPVAALPRILREVARAGYGPGPLLTVLPGSRRSEVARLAPIFGAALGRLAVAVPDLRVVIPVAPNVAGEVAAAVAGWPVTPQLLTPGDDAAKLTAFAASDAALAASGTVVLELAAMGCPMVAAYRVHPLTALVVRQLVRVRTGNLVNLLTESQVVPEFLQERCTPDALAGALIPLLSGTGAAAQRAAMGQAMDAVGRGGPPPADRAAEAVLRVLGARA